MTRSGNGHAGSPTTNGRRSVTSDELENENVLRREATRLGFVLSTAQQTEMRERMLRVEPLLKRYRRASLDPTREAVDPAVGDQWLRPGEDNNR